MSHMPSAISHQPLNREMRIRTLPSARAVAQELASQIATAVARHPRLVLGLPTGRTPIPLYNELARLHASGRIDFAGVVTFNLDEFLGLRGGDPRSYRAFMQRHLFDHINVPRNGIHFLNGIATDVPRECMRYERAIARAGGIDLLILGLGANGHIGFNEPARALAALTHCTTLRLATRRANAGLFGGQVDAVPRQALSMGMATILHANRIVLIATGAGKAECVARMIEGPVTPHLPASFLQLHTKVEIWLDRAAAGRLAHFQ
jgi:glucosamine-6-phosphate deaminase